MLQSLKLADDLMNPVKNGLKTSTVRLGVRPISLGPLLLEASSNPLDTVEVFVTSVLLKPVYCLTNIDAHSDNYKDVEELKKALSRFYPDMKDDDLLTVVTWKAVK